MIVTARARVKVRGKERVKVSKIIFSLLAIPLLRIAHGEG